MQPYQHVTHGPEKQGYAYEDDWHRTPAQFHLRTDHVHICFYASMHSGTLVALTPRANDSRVRRPGQGRPGLH